MNKQLSDAQTEVANSEVQEYLYLRQERRRLFPLAALVGLSAGLVAVLFRDVLSLVDTMRNSLILWSRAQPLWGWIIPMLYSAAGAIIALLLVRRYAPETSGSGIPHLEAVLQRLRNLNWSRVLPIKFLAGSLAIGAGLVLGREGPTVQMGGAVGDAIARIAKVSARERLTLIAAGAGPDWRLPSTRHYPGWCSCWKKFNAISIRWYSGLRSWPWPWPILWHAWVQIRFPFF